MKMCHGRQSDVGPSSGGLRTTPAQTWFFYRAPRLGTGAETLAGTETGAGARAEAIFPLELGLGSGARW